jgi:hypothetical protein
MSDRFLCYLRAERQRLDHALVRAEEARSAGRVDETEIASLRRQKRIVDDQLARWSTDLREEAVAA